MRCRMGPSAALFHRKISHSPFRGILWLVLTTECAEAACADTECTLGYGWYAAVRA